ncbi:cytochrome P450 4d1 [Culex pipiens pallens]|uniref:cytochrome P450 4d1 n=1 Tax=Culex pipiens pallens TaxID=42434 RepID=UPI0022AB4DB0|nr:cytochrome P450 4d1 [Culex pipiens pallens]
MALLLVLISVAIAVTIVVYQKFANLVQYGSKIAGPKAYPVVGNAIRFLSLTPAGFLEELHALSKEWGKCFRIWLGVDLLIFLMDARKVETILSSQKFLDKSIEYDFIRPWLGDGLLTSSGRKWHSRRKIITPTFHFKILEEFVEIFDQQSTVFVDQIKPMAASGEPFDVYPRVTLMALDVICESAMGTKVNAQLNADSDYVRAVKAMTNIVIVRAFQILARLDFTFKYTPYAKIQKQALAVLHGYTDNVIQSRRKELSKTNSQKDFSENDVGQRKKVAFLDMLLQATTDGQPLTDLEIREEVDTFMFEGHDTTTSAMSFLLGKLAKHPEVQNKVYDEVRNVFGDDPSKPATLAMLNELNYLDLVIKETLRLYPSVPMFGRKMMENHDIDGTIFPAGSNVIIMPYIMGRDPDYFEDPLEFRPERFAVETSAEKSNPYRYVPFSAGPRNCIGQKFAVAEIKSLFSKTLRHYEILPDFCEEPEKLYSEATLKNEKGVMLRLKKRSSAYPVVGNAARFFSMTPAVFFFPQTVLGSQKYLDKSTEYDFIRPWLGDGLLTSSGRKWHSRRKIITPTFHFKILEQFVEIFDQQSTVFVDQLKPMAASGEPFDVYPRVTLCALDVICESAMGTKVNAQLNADSEYVRAVKAMSNVAFQRTYKILARLELTFKYTSYAQIQEKALAVLHGYTDSVVKNRRKELTKSNGDHNQNDVNDVGQRKKVAFLDMLLQATTTDGKPLTDLEIREEVDTFMFEGHDTTTSAMSFLLGVLAKHPEVQKKAYDEVRNVFGDDPSKPATLAMLNELNYLDMVIKETLRLYPSVPIFGRKMLENHDIDGTIFPAGSNVIIMPYIMGRDPDYFDDPLEFRPERFAVETSAEKSNPYRYVPFSAGPRNCIGQKFAVAEIKSLVSKTLRHYEILPDTLAPPEKLLVELILRAENGVTLRLKKRN